MNKTVELLQFITQTAYKTQATLKSIALNVEDSNDSNIQSLNILLELIKINSIKSTLDIIKQTGQEDINESVHIIQSSIENSIKYYTNLKENALYSAPENLKYRLNANVQSLLELSVQLGSVSDQCSKQ